tara:strand:+ start:232 stop:501 length:270 start_codon:yes stop_codon:yes gene_type:complete
MKNQKLKELFNSKKNDVKIMEYYNECYVNSLIYYPLAPEWASMRTTINYILGVDSPHFPANYDTLEMGLEIIFNTNYEKLIKEGLVTQK